MSAVALVVTWNDEICFVAGLVARGIKKTGIVFVYLFVLFVCLSVCLFFCLFVCFL